MPPLSDREFTRRFRGLSAAERRQFLAELFAARGDGATVENGVVVARRDGATRRIGVVGALGRDPPDADVVVSTRDTRWARRAADRTNAEYLPPPKLLDMLAYGVDRDAGERLAATYLGTGLTVPESDEDAGDSRSRERLVVAVAVAVAVVAVVSLSGVGLPFGDDPGDPLPTPQPGGAVPTPDTDAEDAESNGTGPDENLYPEGLDGDGVVNASVLLETHQGQIQGRPRTAELTYSGPANTTVFPGTVHHETVVSVHDASRFRLIIDEQRVVDGGSDDADGDPNTTERYLADHWSDGQQVHMLIGPEGDRSYRVQPLSDRTQVATFESFLNEQFRAAMAANETDVERLTVTGVELFRVDAAGAPEEFRDPAAEYTAHAYLTTDGRLVRMTVSYVHPPTGETVRMTIAYSDLDDVPPPEQPDWVADAYDDDADDADDENGGDDGSDSDTEDDGDDGDDDP